MNRPKVLKLIVKDSANSLEVLKYLDKNITEIVRLGVRIKIEKIKTSEFNEEMVNILKRKGVTRLPALLMPDTMVYTGTKSIIGLFEKNLNTSVKNQRVSPAAAPVGDINDYWMQQLYDGRDSGGKLVPRDDGEEEPGGGSNLEKSMRRYERNMPKHRRDTGRDTERDTAGHGPRGRSTSRNNVRDNNVRDRSPDNIMTDDPPPARRSGSRGNARQPHRDEYDFGDDDGGGDFDFPVRSGSKSSTPKFSGGSGDDLDDRMLAAWMDNNPSES
jgi:hypothetical protein